MTDMGFDYEHISNGSMVTTELTDWLIENPQNQTVSSQYSRWMRRSGKILQVHPLLYLQNVLSVDVSV